MAIILADRRINVLGRNACSNRKGHERWAETMTTTDIKGFTGRMIRKDAEVIMFFKVRGKYYPATNTNCEVMDAYMHTGDTAYLNQFEDEVEL